MKPLINLLTITIYLFTCFILGFSQKNLEKPWTEWNKDDCSKLLNQSPWTIVQQNAETQINGERVFDDRIKNGMEREGVKFGGIPKVMIRLYSSNIIRQALVRLAQIQNDYDKMNEIQKKEFDSKYKPVLDCPKCEKYYVVVVMLISSRALTNDSLIFFRKYELPELKKIIFLGNEKGEKRELVEFIKPQKGTDPLILFFNRFDEKNNLLVKLENKKIKLKLDNDNDNLWKMIIPKEVTFDVQKITIDGKVSF